MKLSYLITTSFFLFVFCAGTASCQNKSELKIVFLRHGEKPANGDNLTCQGLNRSLQLPAMFTKKFGVPNYVFVPALTLGEATQHSRMFQTVTPLAAKYNLTINSRNEEKDYKSIAADLASSRGLVLVVWEHNAMPRIIRALGIKVSGLNWPDNDFDSIWIVTFKKGGAEFTRDKEGLKPSAGCPF
jgi:hypothetical protein